MEFIEQDNREKNINETLNECLEMWVKFCEGSKIKRYEIEESYKILKNTQDLDFTGLTTAMILMAFFEEVSVETKISVLDIINKDKASINKINEISSLISKINSPNIKEAVDSFIVKIKDVTKTYSVGDSKLSKEEKVVWENNLLKYIENPAEMAYLRKDALLALDKLTTSQFSKGKNEDNFSYQDTVFQFWNINSAIVSAANQKMSGVTLCLIRDLEEGLFSYFAFLIKSGENIYVISDKENFVYPGQKYILRRPDRLFRERAFKYHFPYHFLEYSPTGNSSFEYVVKDQNGLVPYNTVAFPLATIKDSEPEQFIWIVMMFELIREKFFKKDFQCEELSYTGEMVLNPTTLEERTSLKINKNDFIEIKKFKSEDLGLEEHDGDYQHAPKRFNSWMEERYSDKVPENLLNLIGFNNERLISSCDKKESPLTFLQEESIKLFGNKDSLNEIQFFNVTEFSEKRNMEKDVRYIARYNQSQIVYELAKKEFEEKREEIVDWYKKCILENKENILNSIAKLYFEGVTQETDDVCRFDHSKKVTGNILEVVSISHSSLFFPSPISFYTKEHNKRLCFENKTQASIVGFFYVSTAESISKICNKKIDELPVFLQNFYKEDPYNGNHILNRLDPMDEKIENPWKNLDLNVCFYLSKRAFNSRRKNLGLGHFNNFIVKKYD